MSLNPNLNCLGLTRTASDGPFPSFRLSSRTLGRFRGPSSLGACAANAHTHFMVSRPKDKVFYKRQRNCFPRCPPHLFFIPLAAPAQEQRLAKSAPSGALRTPKKMFRHPSSSLLPACLPRQRNNASATTQLEAQLLLIVYLYQVRLCCNVPVLVLSLSSSSSSSR